MDDQYLFLEFHFPINICKESVLYAAILDKAKVSRKLEHIAVFFLKKNLVSDSACFYLTKFDIWFINWLTEIWKKYVTQVDFFFQTGEAIHG